MARQSMVSSHLFLLMLKCFLCAAASVKGSAIGRDVVDDSGSFLQSDSSFAGDLDQDAVSQHMARLYEKYNKERRLREGNTVRSFRASQDSSDSRTVYRLNLTTLQDSEVVLSATFYFPLDRRAHPKPWFCKHFFKSSPCRSAASSSSVPSSPAVSLLLRSVSPGSEVRSGSLLGNVTFHPHRRGAWQMKDMSRVIKESRDKGHLLLSVELDLGQHQRKPEEALSAGGLPYLILYANDQALEEPNSVAKSLQRYDPFGEGGEPSYNSAKVPQRPNSSRQSEGRVRREALFDGIQDNELPEVDYRPDVYRKDELWESTWYLALKAKPRVGKKEKKRKNQEDKGEEEVRGANDKGQPGVLKEGAPHRVKTDDSIVKNHKDSSNGNGLKQREKDGKKHKGGAHSHSPLLSFDEQTMRKARRRQWADTQHRGCSRRNLRVDFADIGWSEWVIAPKAFDAYYCAGTCGFPMPKVARPSNHATIQSIVRAVGIIPGVPEPCCVPEKMSPLAVLYRDESRNPVLKIYPNMSVQSCSCR